MPMWIVVDANESRCGLAKLLARTWNHVEVKRLPVGDVAIGDRIVVERKTNDDLRVSLNDGRLFRQARQLAETVDQPIVLVEGDPRQVCQQMGSGEYWGAVLAICVGFGIPLLTTLDVEGTARLLRHMAAQESKRAARRRRWGGQGIQASGPPATPAPLRPQPLPFGAFDVLLALPQVGPTRAKALAARIGGLGDLAKLGVRDLMDVPGIGADTAARIVDALRAGEAGRAAPKRRSKPSTKAAGEGCY